MHAGRAPEAQGRDGTEMAGVKIATCCFCGTRAALVLRGRERHELSCSACGAPLHDMKMLPKTPAPAPRPAPGPAPAARGSHHRAMTRRDDDRPRKYKKRKSFARRALGEIWDVIEDLID